MAIKGTSRSLRFLLRESGDYQRPILFWRMTSVFVIMSQLLMVDAGMAQVSNPSIIAVSVVPSGACTANLPLKLKTPDGTLWSCYNGTYGQVGGSSSGVTTVGNSDGTLSISPTSGTVTASLNLGHANSWTALQTFNAGIAGTLSGNAFVFSDNGGSGNISGSTTAFGDDYFSAASFDGNAKIILQARNPVAGLDIAGLYAGGTYGNLASAPFRIGAVIVAGSVMSDSVAGDTLVNAPSGKVTRIGSGTGASAMQVGSAANAFTISTTVQTITFSATPAITTAEKQTITLTGDATPTVTIISGEHLVLQICQDGTGSHAWTWPATIHGGVTIGATASTCSQQAFDSFNGTTLVAENQGVINVAP